MITTDYNGLPVTILDYYCQDGYYDCQDYRITMITRGGLVYYGLLLIIIAIKLITIRMTTRTTLDY